MRSCGCLRGPPGSAAAHLGHGKRHKPLYQLARHLLIGAQVVHPSTFPMTLKLYRSRWPPPEACREGAARLISRKHQPAGQALGKQLRRCRPPPRRRRRRQDTAGMGAEIFQHPVVFQIDPLASERQMAKSSFRPPQVPFWTGIPPSKHTPSAYRQRAWSSTRSIRLSLLHSQQKGLILSATSLLASFRPFCHLISLCHRPVRRLIGAPPDCSASSCQPSWHRL